MLGLLKGFSYPEDKQGLVEMTTDGEESDASC